ncbi:MAG: nucleotidyltransferase family protein, partial [Clostridia bacterium]|nr:nucleotidyltransferase family protein [Clostridia bacterium]
MKASFMPEKKIVAITAEYNPLHNGHLKLIE